jgi:hypothetical protein
MCKRLPDRDTEVNVRATHRPASTSAQAIAGRCRDGQPQRPGPGVVVYCLAAGAVSLVAGAALSLVASGAARVIVWGAVSFGSSVAAGLAYEPGVLFRACRFLRGLARP